MSRAVSRWRYGIEVCVKFRWYDFWIGWYWDRKERALYICPLPMVVFEVWTMEYRRKGA